MRKHIVRIPGLVIFDHEFVVPLDYSDPKGTKISIFAREIVTPEKEEKSLPWYLSVQAMTSAKVTPRPHISMAWSYYLLVRITSGARYHLELTVHVMLLFYFFTLSEFFWMFSDTSYLVYSGFRNYSSFSTLGIVLARPKSQYITLQDPSMRMFPGLISLWITPAECMNFIPHSIL